MDGEASPDHSTAAACHASSKQHSLAVDNANTSGTDGNPRAETDGSGCRLERVGSPPPYWARPDNRRDSTWSLSSNNTRNRHTIALQDNERLGSESSKALWAKHVTVSDYVVVSGSAPRNLASYIVWNCTVDTLDGGPIHIRKRYSEFDKLRRNLVRTFPLAEGAIPPLPPKSVIHRFQPDFLEKRRIGLAYFLNCVLLNPEFSGSPVLKDFLFS